MLGLILFLGLLQQQPDPHSHRLNKVWSVEITYEPCKAEFIKSMQGVWDIKEKAFIGELTPAPLGRIIFQWSYSLPEVTNKEYKMMDMLMDMSDRIYYFDLLGTMNEQVFFKRIWVSPGGISYKPINEYPPKRETLKGNWTPKEGNKALDWLANNHNLIHRNLFREYGILQKRMDHGISFDLFIGESGCNKESEVVAD